MILPRDGLEREIPFLKEREGILAAPQAVQPFSRQLSDYTVLETIGSGLRGTVYRARARANRFVALKIFNRGVSIDATALARFSPAAEEPIAHPNLIPVEAVGTSEGRTFCAMALLRGDSLDLTLAELRGDRRTAPHLSPLGTSAGGRPRPGFMRHAVGLLADVADGLDRAHGAGLVHTRIAPRNLILTPSGRLVVTDFGSERPMGSVRRVGYGVSHDLSTLTYRAPEQIDPFETEVDHRADIYALGAVLYEILTRTPAFAGRDPQQVHELIAEGRFTPPSRVESMVTKDAEAVILRAMALAPADRYQSAAEMADDLRRLLLLEATRAGIDLQSNAPPPEAAAEVSEAQDEGLKPPPPATPVMPAMPARPAMVNPEFAPKAAEVPHEGVAGEPAAAIPGVPEIPAQAPQEAMFLEPTRVEEAIAAPSAERSPRAAVRAAKKAQRRRRIGVGVACALIVAALSGWTWLTLTLHDTGERHRSRADRFAAGVRLLEKAVVSLWREEPESARDAVAETRRLGVQGPDLARVEASLAETSRDPHFRDLLHPRACVRKEAVSAIAGEIEAGRRSSGDLDVLRTALGDGDPDVRRAAIEAMAHGSTSAPLLAAFPIGEGLPPVAIDTLTFVLLVTALAEIADAPAVATLLSWKLEDLERIDGPPSEDPSAGSPSVGTPAVQLPPNLFLTRAAGDGGSVCAEWIRALARISSPGVLSLAQELREGNEALLPHAAAIIDGLIELGSREAAHALASLAEPLYLDHASRIAAGLLVLLESEELLRLARGTLPSKFRALATRTAGKTLLMEAGPSSLPADHPAAESARPERKIRAAEGLAELLRQDPSPEVRRAALHALVDAERAGLRGAAWGTASLAGLLPAALDDLDLREEALGLLDRRPLPETFPILLDLLLRGDCRLRARSAAAIGATGDPAALVPLSRLLRENDESLREAAAGAMCEISLPRAFPFLAGHFPPRSALVRELAWEVARLPVETGENVALRILAVREALGLEGADEPTAALGAARRALLRGDFEPGRGWGDFFLPSAARCAGGGE